MIYWANTSFEDELSGKCPPFSKKPLHQIFDTTFLFEATPSDTVLLNWIPSGGYLEAMDHFLGGGLPNIQKFSVDCIKKGSFVPWGWAPSLNSYLPDGITAHGVHWANSKLTSSSLFQEFYPERVDGAIVREIEEVHAFVSRHSGEGRFVLKSEFGVAGRGNLIFNLEEESILPLLKKYLKENGACVLEPWRERLLDLGTQLQIHSDGRVEFIGVNEILSGPNGFYQGARLGIEILNGVDENEIRSVCERVGRRLFENGYFGVCGIDSMVAKNPRTGEPTYYPLSEINARYGMGWIAHRVAKKVLKGVDHQVVDWIHVSPSRFKSLALPKKFSEWESLLGELFFEGNQGVTVLSPSLESDPFKKVRPINFCIIGPSRESVLNQKKLLFEKFT